MLKMFCMVRFVKAVAAAADQCQDELTKLDGWTTTFIGKNDRYHVKDGVVTETEAYAAFLSFYDKVRKELNRYRFGRRTAALAWFMKHGFRKAT